MARTRNDLRMTSMATGESTFPGRVFRNDLVSEEGIRRRMAAPGSLASWVWNFDNEEGAELQSLLARGKYAEAKELGDSIVRKVDANIRPLLALRNARGMSDAGDMLADRADRMTNGILKSVVVNVGGKEMTAEQALAGDGDLAVQMAGDEFEALGMNRAVADMMFNGNDQQRALFRGLVNPLLSGNVKNRVQRIDLAEEVAANWDKYESAFGDGTTYMVQRLQDLHPDSGGTVEVLRSLAALAPAVTSGKGIEGKELARDLVSGYEALSNRIYAADSTGVDSSGRPVKIQVSPSKRMALDSSLCASLQECARRGISVDLASPVFANALSEASDLVAYSSSLGVDLVADGHDVGRPFSRSVGEFVADVASGLETPASNQVNALRSVRNMLNNLIIGGNDYAETAYRMTGNPQDYLASMNKANSGFSSSPGADAMALGIKAFLLQRMSSGIMSGKDANTALTDAMSGGLHSGTDFLVGLSDVISAHLSGPDKTKASDLLASRLMETLSSGHRASVQDTVYDLAFGSDDGSSEQGILRNWYSGNVAQAVRDAQKMTQLRSHLTADEHVSDQKAVSEVAKAAQEAAQMERMGQDWNQVYDARIRMGSVYVAEPGVVNPMTGLPVVRKIVDDRSKYGFQVDGDNSAFESSQQAFKETYDYNNRAQIAAVSAAGRKSQDTGD